MPLAVLVLLAASGAGLVARRTFYADSEQAPGATAQQSLPQQPASPPGSSVVEFSPDAAGHPDFEPVRSMLQNHFDSINSTYYERWRATVVDERRNEMPEEDWAKDYESTSDSEIKVHRIDYSAPDDSLRVLITFTSRQNPADSPDQNSPCLHWRVVYPLVVESGQLLLDSSPYSRSSQHKRC